MSEMPAVLFHATAEANLDGVLERGLAAGSCVTSDREIAIYYADGIEEEGEPSVIIEIDAAALVNLVGEDAFEIDSASIAEPITTALGKSEDQVIAEWSAVSGDGTWRDCLEVVRSFKVMRVIPVEAIMAPAPEMVP